MTKKKSAAKSVRVAKETGRAVAVTVRLTAAQAAIFAPAAEQSKATVGEVLLALACDRVTFNPTSGADDAQVELEALLWSYAGRRATPRIDEGWEHAGFPVSGLEVANA